MRRANKWLSTQLFWILHKMKNGKCFICYCLDSITLRNDKRTRFSSPSTLKTTSNSNSSSSSSHQLFHRKTKKSIRAKWTVAIRKFYSISFCRFLLVVFHRLFLLLWLCYWLNSSFHIQLYCIWFELFSFCFWQLCIVFIHYTHQCIPCSTK